MTSFKSVMAVDLVNSWDKVPNGCWDLLEDLYIRYNEEKSTTQKIPKKIHQIWIGEIPETIIELSNQIKTINSDWEYKLWTMDDLKDYPMRNKNLFDCLQNPGSKSDVARYEIIYNEGGIYLDTDFKVITKFDSIINCDFFTGVGHSKEPMVFNGLFGSTPKNIFLESLLTSLKNQEFDCNTNDKESIMNFSGPYFFSNQFFSFIKQNPSSDFVVFPTPYFYPLPATERNNVRNNINHELITQYISDKTICVHLWFCSWQ